MNIDEMTVKINVDTAQLDEAHATLGQCVELAKNLGLSKRDLKKLIKIKVERL